MATFIAVWLILGFIVIATLLVCAIIKRLQWPYFFVTLGCFVLISFMFFTLPSLITPSHSSSSAKESSSQSSSHVSPHAKIFKLVYSDDEDYYDGAHFDSNKDGEYTVKIKGLNDGKIKIKNNNEEASNKKFKAQTFKIEKGQTLKVPITLQGDDLTHDFKVVDNHGHSKKFTIYNNSATANSIASSMDASESADNQGNDASASSTAKYPHYKNNEKVADAINDDFSSIGDDKYENTHAQYRDSIFYVSVPNSVTASPSTQQKAFFETVARTIHSYQKRPTGVIYFEDQQGNVLAKTKAINNNEVKMK